jgi:ankyrin repeat protein
MHASEAGHAEVVKLLIETGADAEMTNKVSW